MTTELTLVHMDTVLSLIFSTGSRDRGPCRATVNEIMCVAGELDREQGTNVVDDSELNHEKSSFPRTPQRMNGNQMTHHFILINTEVGNSMILFATTSLHFCPVCMHRYVDLFGGFWNFH